MKLTETELRQHIKESIKKGLQEAHRNRLPYDPRDPNNIVSLEYDPNTKFGDEWAKTKNNFAVRRGGQVFYVSRNTSMSIYAFCKNKNDEWCVLAVKRGPKAHGGNGLFAVPGGYLDMAHTIGKNGMKQYETLEMGIAREVYEETGVKIDIHRISQYSTNSNNKDINVCFTAIVDGTTDQYPTSTANCEVGEIDVAAWIPFSKLNNLKWAYNQEHKIPAIARTVLGNYDNPDDDKIETIIAQLRQEIGQNQRGQWLLKQLITAFNR